MINYLHDLLLYISNNPKLISLLIILTLLGISYFSIPKIKRTLKDKKKLKSNINNNSSSENTGGNTKPYNKYYTPEHNTEHSHSSNFFAESVSQVFESKTHKRGR
ncbi:hypothetical protein K6025_05585 [Ehrlichia sp. JZT12]